METSYSRWHNAAGIVWYERTPVTTNTGHDGYDYRPDETTIYVGDDNSIGYANLDYQSDMGRHAELTAHGATNDWEEIVTD